MLYFLNAHLCVHAKNPLDSHQILTSLMLDKQKLENHQHKLKQMKHHALITPTLKIQNIDEQKLDSPKMCLYCPLSLVTNRVHL